MHAEPLEESLDPKTSPPITQHFAADAARVGGWGFWRRSWRSGWRAYFARDTIGLRGQAAAGIVFFFGIVAAFSANLRAVNWQTIGWGVMLQMILALLVLKVPFVYHGFEGLGYVVKQFISFSDQGAKFVFGNLYDARPPQAGGTWSVLFGTNYMFQFAFVALPPILFVSAFFTVLYHFGILQMSRAAAGRGDGPLDAHQRCRNALGRRQRVHGSDRSAADRQALRAADDQFGAVRADGQRHGPHLGRHDGRLHQLRRRSGGRAHHVRDGLPVQPVPVEAVPAGSQHAGNGRHGPHEEGEIAVRERHRRRGHRHAGRPAAGAQRRGHADRVHRVRGDVRRAPRRASSRDC